MFFPASRSTPRYYTFFLISAKNPKSEEKNGICFLVIHWINNEPKKNNKCWNLQTKYSLIKNYNFCIFDKSGITSVNIYPLTAWYISIKRVYRTYFFLKRWIFLWGVFRKWPRHNVYFYTQKRFFLGLGVFSWYYYAYIWILHRKILKKDYF